MKYYKETNPSFDEINSDSYLNFTENFDYKDKCFKACPSECDASSFTYNTYEFPFSPISSFSPTSSYSNISRSHIFHLYVYYQFGMEYTAINQMPKVTVSNLISNIGGTIGNLLN